TSSSPDVGRIVSLIDLMLQSARPPEGPRSLWRGFPPSAIIGSIQCNDSRRAAGVARNGSPPVPLQDYMQIISVDDHMIEHPRVWTDRLPSKWADDMPVIIENEHGHHIWRYEGQLFPYIGLNAVAGKEPKDFGMEPVRYDDMIPGCYDPVARVADMDVDGVQAALCFPSFPGFGGGVFQRAKDKELALACVQAWNDYSIDEWSAAAPDRYIPLAILPTW